MTLNMASFAAALKQHYTDDRVQNLVYQNNPLLAIVPKMESFGGKNLPIPIQYGVPGSRSASFLNAVNQKGTASSAFKDFVLTRVQDYCLASIDNETMEASIGNPNAFMEAAANEIDSALLSCTRSLATALFRDGTGVIGTIAAAPAPTATTFRLVNPEDIVNFEVGMTLTTSTAADATTVVETVVILSVDRDDGDVVTTAAAAPMVAGHLLACQGDLPPALGAAGVKVSGLSAWVPDAAPGAAAFFGVDRTADTSRLGGVRFDAGAIASKIEALTKASARLAREGGRPTHVFMNHIDYGLLLQELNLKVSYAEVEAYERGDISFSSCRVHTPSGTVLVTPDHNCPTGKAYMLQMDTWKLYSLGSAPKILQSDGMRMLRETNADAVEVRVGYYAQLGCRAPGHNCVITGF